MDKEETPYREKFPAGSKVRIKDKSKLEDFRRTWKFHNPISAEQIGYAGNQDSVVGVAWSFPSSDALRKRLDNDSSSTRLIKVIKVNARNASSACCILGKFFWM